MNGRETYSDQIVRAAVGMGIPMGFPWVWVWYGYGDCDESPWVLWVICGDF